MFLKHKANITTVVDLINHITSNKLESCLIYYKTKPENYKTVTAYSSENATLVLKTGTKRPLSGKLALSFLKKIVNHNSESVDYPIVATNSGNDVKQITRAFHNKECGIMVLS
jgi:hypothetical protein